MPQDVALFINGRFLSQTLSGVQRFAMEVTASLSRVAEEEGLPAPVVLAPRGAAGWNAVTVRQVGRLQGQAWEQIELPWHARRGVLINLGNTAPILAGRQAVVIHDAGVFSTPGTYPLKFRLWYKIMQRILAHGPATLATVSNFARTEIVQHLGAREADILLVSEGADHMQRIEPDTMVLAQHGLTAGRFVLAVGNLAAHKNLSALGETARALHARGIALVITGGLDSAVFGASLPDLPRPARYVGRVSDQALRTLYGQAACFVFPSLYEGFGLPAIEAMACGCPVVASGIPALREVCGDAALYCNPADPADIAAAICMILDDAVLCERLQSAMAARVAQFSWAAAGRQLLEVARLAAGSAAIASANPGSGASTSPSLARSGGVP